MNKSQSKGRYDSPLRRERAARTRRRILEAARRLFSRQGYAATTLAEIADEVGVSVQTIYNSVGGKGAVLLALNDVVDEVADVEAIQRRIGECEDPQEILRLVVRLRRQLMEGADDIIRILEAAAHSDPEVARVLEDGRARRRAGTRRVVERLRALGALREDLDVAAAADATYAALDPSVWTRLVDDCGWSPETFEGWCADLLGRMLLQ